MAGKVTKSRIRNVIDMAVAFALGSVVVVPVVSWIKSKMGV